MEKDFIWWQGWIQHRPNFLILNKSIQVSGRFLWIALYTGSIPRGSQGGPDRGKDAEIITFFVKERYTL
jgi:hypothetical protein